MTGCPKALQPTPRPTESQVAKAIPRGSRLTADQLGFTMWKEQLVDILCSPDPEFSRLDELFVLKNRHLPRSLFKYRCFTDHALRNLSDDNVWLADPTTFNDPYDSAFGVVLERVVSAFGDAVAPQVVEHAAATGLISADELSALTTGPDLLDRLTHAIASREGSLPPARVDEFLSVLKPIVARRDAQLVEGLAAAMRNTLTLCSFSEVNDSILMWSHYTNHHRGFCIEYPIISLPEQDIRRRLLYPVVYSDVLLDSTAIFERMAAGKPFNNLFPIGACLRKSPVWSYEKEWRLVVPGGIFPEATTYSMPAASAIYLGAHLSQEDRATLTEIGQQRAIPVFQMSLSRTRFNLEAARL